MRTQKSDISIASLGKISSRKELCFQETMQRSLMILRHHAGKGIKDPSIFDLNELCGKVNSITLKISPNR